MKTPLNLLILGSCHVHYPLANLRPDAPPMQISSDYGPIGPIHTFGEMFQIIDILRGKKTILPEYMNLCRMAGLVPVPAAAGFDDIDLVLVEPATWVELTFRGVAVNRSRVLKHVVAPIRRAYPEATRLAQLWLRAGLQGLDEAKQEKLGAGLLEIVRGDTEEEELIRCVIREIRASKSNIGAEMRTLQEMLGRPLALVSSVFRYMPDGRAVRLPAGFAHEIKAVARAMGLALFNPAPLVIDYGVARAIIEESRHYSDAFLPVMGEALAKFAASVARSQR